MKNKMMGLSFNAVIKRIDKYTGKVLEEEKVHNIITNLGLERIVKLLGGISTTAYNSMAIGTSATAETASDVALGVEVIRATPTISYVADYKVKFEKLFSFGSGESYTITEAGLFDSLTPSGSIIFNRLTFTGKAVDSNTDLSVVITITSARA